ncbi:DUF488 domain-containing protein [Methylacidimicrobium cyclopophantes]|uniref:DUF488 domain-containing protein n=1 Tax=Methylacidimicrobium cyclopophantes TaxID=1041766 RepID=UPI001157867B|nr:DUF488 domain-containing protein [Methylacidimicrobium cyclopophantes]
MERKSTQRLPSDSPVFTLGHGTRSLEELLRILQSKKIERVVDIRTIPRSRHNPQFNKETLSAALAAHDIAYTHMTSLGGLRHPKRDSKNQAWRNASFRGFADSMETPEFSLALDRLEQEVGKIRLVLLCAETVPWRCHRWLIADSLLARGIPVEHLLDATHSQPHRLTPWARIVGRRVTYPSSPEPPTAGDPASLRSGREERRSSPAPE